MINIRKDSLEKKLEEIEKLKENIKIILDKK